MNNNILITGCAGFIGYHLSDYMCANNYNVYGIDNLNEYYSKKLKNDRLIKLEKYNNFKFSLVDITDNKKLAELFKSNNFSCVINLAAQAGVRYSFENPQAYIDSNITGFINILENCKKYNIKSLIYASSSSVYGECNNSPFSENDTSIMPISLYGVTKKFNEELAYSYYNLFGINSIGLRFFTVYGPWGRPDMALYKFVNNILNDDVIDVYNHGEHSRSFTYIDDIVQSIGLLCNNFGSNKNYFEIFNIGGDKSVKLMDFIQIISDRLDKKVKMNFLPKQVGDIKSTESDCRKLYEHIKFKPKIDIKSGINNFIDWYIEYHK